MFIYYFFFYYLLKAETIEPFPLKISPEDFVRKKTGKITTEYKLASRALGKGGFGEVRKGVHRASGLKRAIKMVSKNDLKESEKNQLIDEVETLKNLVFFIILFNLIFILFKTKKGPSKHNKSF